eukprot:TRINITY_DN6607_c0_g1_i1.p1 TRINITY_DN6607_c0_g1~~TRINITY_DN6607_c0_g1_i1.p1  ORF type:complete len:528 (-),score=100.79 TRINITY_DN6607_c0_g1_i1:11-1465(-)
MKKRVLEGLSIPKDGSKLSLHFSGETRDHVFPIHDLPAFAFTTMRDEPQFCCRAKLGGGNYSYSETDPLQDHVYFGSYEFMQIHWEMLSDYKRCGAYYQAMMDFNQDVRGKVVLDVGCGTGILSIYAAMAGAKKVYAVDASGIVTQAKQMIKKNGYQDVIEIINGKIEEITLPVDSVDAIVSEWMGYFLFCESMVEAVLFARDKWLKPDGKLFPCEANLYLAPIVSQEFYADKVKWFKESLVDGVDVSVLEPYAAAEFTSRCLRCHDLRSEEILTQPLTVSHVDLYTASEADVRNARKGFKFTIPKEQNVVFKWEHNPDAQSVYICCSSSKWQPIEMQKQGKKFRVALWLSPGTHQYKFIVDGKWVHDWAKPSVWNNGNQNNILELKAKEYKEIHGFGSWFDVVFKGSDETKDPIVLTTDPRTGFQTCWKQDICLFNQPIVLNQSKTVTGTVFVDRLDQYHRHFQISITAKSAPGPTSTQAWTV